MIVKGDRPVTNAATSQPNLVDGKYGIEDLVDLEALEQMFDEFSKGTGLPIGVNSYPDQRVLVGTGWEDICTKFHRSCPESSAHCVESNRVLTGGLKDESDCLVHRCGLGLVDAATPIIIKGVHIASLFTGQMLTEKPDRDRFRRQAGEFGYDVDAYLAALDHVQVVSEEKIQHVLAYLNRMAKMIAELGLNRLVAEKAMVALQTENKARMKSQADLMKSSQMLQLVLNTIPQHIFWKDRQSVYLGCNRNFARVSGVGEPTNIVGKTDYDLAWKREEADFFVEQDRRVMESGSPAYHTIEPQLQADGKEAWLDTTKVPILDIQGEVVGILGTYEDITERIEEERRQQELRGRLEKAERMEAIGVLAGGVAHDLNNMLGPLVGYPELILRKLSPESPLRRQIERIGDSARDAAAVIQDLLTLARRGSYEMEPVNFSAIVEKYFESPGYVRMAEKHPEVALVTHIAPEVSSISGSPGHLTKVVTNLVSNAYDAMSDGGTLTVTACQRQINRLLDGHSEIAPGEYVILTVRDTGVGIASEDLGKIFEPYYSKKKMRINGNGLGLPVVYGVVKDHQGYYDITSTVGEGTEFTLYFPVSRETVGDLVRADGKLTGTERILVVDDVKEQRDLASEMLSGMGYGVATANSGHAAIAHLRKQSVDLVILDMIMERDFDGLDTYREIVSINPGQKAIIVSGYSATERVLEAQELGVGKYVRKPYTIDVLARTVRHELDRESQPTLQST